MHAQPHPLDQALALTPTSSGHYLGRTTAAYWNMVGPYGGISAALMLNAVLQHPQLLGEPLSLTVNYVAPVAQGDLLLDADPVRTNRTTQHWCVSARQRASDGGEQLTTTASVVTALRRVTWGVSDAPMPPAPEPAHVARASATFPVEWPQRYEMRPIVGGLPKRWDGGGNASLTRLWVRDAPARALDWCALAGLSDVFFPRVWLRRARQVPAGTVSMTVYFHAAGADLAATGDGYLLAQARAQEFRGGFFDQGVQLWNQAGLLLASSQQIVYYKE